MTVLTSARQDRDAGAVTSRPDPQVPAKAKRRTFTADFKMKVLAEYEAAPEGEKGKVLRKYGLHSSHLVDWRRSRDAGAAAGLAKTRGRPAADPRDKELERLRAENERLQERLRKAELVIEVQGKVRALLQDLSESAPTPPAAPRSPRKPKK
jgi:transposase